MLAQDEYAPEKVRKGNDPWVKVKKTGGS
jgi:hypothetical protein